MLIVKQFWKRIFKIATKKWYVIASEWRSTYSHHDPITFLTKSIESNLGDYSDAYILVTWHILVKRRHADNTDDVDLNAATHVAFKNCAPFKDCRTEINDTFVDHEDFVNIAMPMYNLIEYSDNYSDTSGSLWGLKRDEVVNNADVTNNDYALSFKYKAGLITDAEIDGKKWSKNSCTTNIFE